MSLRLQTHLLISFFLMGIYSCTNSSPGREVVASIQNREWTVQEAQNLLNRLSRLPGQKVQSAKSRKALIQEMLRKELLFREALDSGFLLESEELKEKIAMRLLQERIGRTQIDPSEQEIREYYEKEKASLDRVRVAHILLKPSGKSEEAKLETRKRIETLRGEIIQGRSFSEAAKLLSKDKASAPQGGDLGFRFHKALEKPFADAAFSLEEKGELSAVVETRFGFHIIQMIETRKGLKTWRDEIVNRLRTQEQVKLAEKFFEDLEKKYDAKIFDENIKKLKTEKNSSKGASL